MEKPVTSDLCFQKHKQRTFLMNFSKKVLCFLFDIVKTYEKSERFTFKVRVRICSIWSRRQDSNLRPSAPKEIRSTCFRLFPAVSAPFRSQTHPFRHSYLHCFRVLRACLWDKLWSKRYSPNTVSAVLREFFVVCMVTLSAPKVKAFRKTNFAPQ